MLFQTLDDKGECVGIYHDGELLFDFENFPQDLTRTWGYNSFLEGYRGVDYAELYALGQSLDQACPDHLKEEWQYPNKLQEFFPWFFFRCHYVMFYMG